MRLPNADHAAIDSEKLNDYCLNPDHPKGKHKARVFYEKLGLTRNDAELLRGLILEAILTSDAVEQESTPYGRSFIVDFEIQRSPPPGFIQYSALVRTAWIIRDGEDFPRMTTCFNPRGSY